jgi:hypothetical protein
LKTVISKPAVNRCPHIDEPMTPVPIQPTFVFPDAISSDMVFPTFNRT